MHAWTAGGLRAGGEVELPPVQMELFIEAGAIVAGLAVTAGAGREVVEAALRQAAEQAGRLLVSARQSER